ncbi:MAG: DNA-processing protein DprA [Gammaproteobacteria bacterium]
MQQRSDLELELALWRIPGIGPKMYSDFLRYVPDLGSLFEKPEACLRGQELLLKFLPYLKKPDWLGVEKDLNWQAQSAQRFILVQKNPNYPRYLSEIKQAPPVLFFEGSLHALNKAQLAIVGSRKPSAGGQELAFQFARELASIGFVITSGLALGIDSAAHRGALSSEKHPVSIGVLACGLDGIYPKQNQGLGESLLAQGGGLVSEFPTGVFPKPEYFPRRNRIISGLSLGVLVVEAALKSGSLITAQYALEQGRDVFAIPGHINNPHHKGCHALIKQGAKLVEELNDITQEFHNIAKYDTVSVKLAESPASSYSLNAGLEHDGFLRYIDYENTPVDLIVARSGLGLPEVLCRLFDLELRGSIAASPGGYTRVLSE